MRDRDGNTTSQLQITLNSAADLAVTASDPPGGATDAANNEVNAPGAVTTPASILAVDAITPAVDDVTVCDSPPGGGDADANVPDANIGRSSVMIDGEGAQDTAHDGDAQLSNLGADIVN